MRGKAAGEFLGYLGNCSSAGSRSGHLLLQRSPQDARPFPGLEHHRPAGGDDPPDRRGLERPAVGSWSLVTGAEQHCFSNTAQSDLHQAFFRAARMDSPHRNTDFFQERLATNKRRRGVEEVSSFMLRYCTAGKREAREGLRKASGEGLGKAVKPHRTSNIEHRTSNLVHLAIRSRNRFQVIVDMTSLVVGAESGRWPAFSNSGRESRVCRTRCSAGGKPFS